MKSEFDKLFEVTHKVTKKVNRIGHRALVRQISKNPELLEYYDFKIVPDTRSIYTFEVWVHPKSGGDDYDEVVEILSDSEDGARRFLEKDLKRRSAVTNDYKLLKVERR